MGETFNSTTIKKIMEAYNDPGNEKGSSGDFYPIIFSSRSGSTYLTELLNLSRPSSTISLEVFAPDVIRICKEQYSKSPIDLVKILRSLSRGKYCIFPKISYHQLYATEKKIICY